MRHAVEVAETLEAPYIRIFSFFIPDGTDPDSRRDEVLSRMSALAEVAAGADVILVHENEKDIYGDIPRRCLDIVTTVSAPKLQLAWDPANFVQVGVRPFTEGYAMLRPHVSTIQIKDALLADGTVVVAGAGDGELRETVRALRADGFDGFFSLEPHLGEYTAFGALSGPELFTKAWKAFTDILTSEGIAVRMSTVSESDHRIRLALVGAGVIGTIHGAVISELADQIDLVAVVDLHRDRAEKLAAEHGGKAFTSLTDALEAVDIDVVSVCTPTGRHGEVAIEALEAGKHVIIEKPAETTVGEDR